ncbi:MAG: LacI family transcriptional regulator [Spirochaetae bacterium HGW-Spirochaetae-2]|jgi:LacI family transcriptional regulator|nr:MAG: LacI family transcriptional regulator [Spirochaetae bacterium HGW-Spirochaetae-2]
MQKRTSISDVAKLAKTSTATVSRIINDTGYPVSAELRARVLIAIETLHYSPSIAAQQLKQDFNPVIGLIARDISAEFFGEIAKGASEKALELGYLSFVCNTGREPHREMQYHELLWRNRVKGIVLIGGGFDDDSYRELLHRQIERAKRFGFRIVANTPQGVDVPCITIDHVATMESVVDYFIDRNHSSIGLITGGANVFTSMDHFTGYRKSLDKHGIPFDPQLASLAGFTERVGYDKTKEILRKRPDVTAFCCGCEPIAIGLYHAVHEAGLEIPKHISVISVGDTSVARYTNPALTAVRVPRYEMGSRAVEMILTKDYTQHTKIILPTNLIERNSTRVLEDS